MQRSWFALVLLAAAAVCGVGQGLRPVVLPTSKAVTSTAIPARDADGWAINGSLGDERELPSSSAATPSTTSAVSDVYSDLETTQWSLGAGYRHGLTDNVDFVGRLAWTMADSDYTSYGRQLSNDSNGVSIEGGVRAAMGKHFEGLCTRRLRRRGVRKRRVLHPRRRPGEVRLRHGPGRRREVHRWRHPVVRGTALQLVTRQSLSPP